MAPYLLKNNMLSQQYFIFLIDGSNSAGYFSALPILTIAE